jgi:hypothetical protein
MGERRNACTVLVVYLLGNLRRRWMDSVKVSLREVVGCQGWTYMELA